LKWGKEEATVDISTTYRQTENLKDLILDVVGKCMEKFDHMWGTMMNGQNILDAFSKVGLTRRTTARQTCEFRSQWNAFKTFPVDKSHHKITHGHHI